MNEQILSELAKTAKNEHELQSYCVQWFRLKYPNELMFAVPNGGLRNIKVASKLKKEGCTPGIPDLFLAKSCKDYSGLFIEMKYNKNTTTPIQKNIHKQLSENNYVVAVCWTYDAFIKVVELYMSNDKLTLKSNLND